MDHPKRELKYVNANALNGLVARLDGAEVYGSDGGKLGVVEIFRSAGRANLNRGHHPSDSWHAHSRGPHDPRSVRVARCTRSYTGGLRPAPYTLTRSLVRSREQDGEGS